MPPFTPQASTMRPTSTASSGQTTPSSSTSEGVVRSFMQPRSSSRNCSLLGFDDQAVDGVRILRTSLDPCVNAVQRQAQGFSVARSQRVVEAHALQETAVTAVLLLSHDDVVESALLGAAACKSNHDHDVSFSLNGRPLFPGDTRG